MRIVTEKLVFDVEKLAKDHFLLTPISCSCEDQSQPSHFMCEEDPEVQHGCCHPSSGTIELPEFDVKLGRQIHFSVTLFMGIPFKVELGPDITCCEKNSNKVLEILP